jgi:hypothetical protein
MEEGTIVLSYEGMWFCKYSDFREKYHRDDEAKRMQASAQSKK